VTSGGSLCAAQVTGHGAQSQGDGAGGRFRAPMPGGMSARSESMPSDWSYTEDSDQGAGWNQAVDQLQGASTFWVATTHPTGRPHVVPVLAVVSGGSLHFAAGPATQKGRNLARDARLSVTTRGEDLDVVVEGDARTVRDERSLADVVAAYLDKYGWVVELRDGRLHGEGAPTAGPPPYDVYRLTPHRPFGFPAGGEATPTRWRFQAS
jgi:nitroimidazol reductase NimA-like FMN-containing flavoprotein (pyridoxamine 5'-phosphate oxidase superfamily)